MPATIMSAATTAEKLNIQPTERSISRMARRNTMPIASMPRKVVLPSSEKRLIGLRNRGRATPMITIMATSATITPISSGIRQPRLAMRISCPAGIGGWSVSVMR